MSLAWFSAIVCSLGELTDNLQSSARGCPDSDHLDSIFGAVLVSLKGHGRVSPYLQSINLWRRSVVFSGKSSDPLFQQSPSVTCALSKWLIQSPQSHCSTSKMTYQDFSSLSTCLVTTWCWPWSTPNAFFVPTSSYSPNKSSLCSSPFILATCLPNATSILVVSRERPVGHIC
ncbi:hypothetical protein EDC04DRAFT_2815056 [Pisolithus marmoratus]|nr:hypothetical protein EDC04DRAFT_2815056 [Pisolithus marmoratus]